MTNSKYAAVEALKIYLARKNDKEYSAIMNKAKADKNFERMIQSITVDRLAGKSALDKNKINF